MRLAKVFKGLLIVLMMPLVMGANWAPMALTGHTETRLKRVHIEQELRFFSKKQRKHIDTMARTLYGEARGERTDNAMTAVAHVILNRVAHKNWAGSPRKVAKQRLQFSCWNKFDPNRVLITTVTLKNKHFRKAYRVAIDVMCRKSDPTNGATHYHSRFMPKKPHWAKCKTMKPMGKFGNHLFYKC